MNNLEEIRCLFKELDSRKIRTKLDTRSRGNFKLLSKKEPRT